MTLPQPLTYEGRFRATAERVPDRPALVFSSERLTYRELLEAAQRRAVELSALSLGRGERFGLLMPNCPALVEYLLAAAFLGATAVPINVRFRAPELRHVIADAELAAVVTTRAPVGPLDLPALLREALPGLVDVDGGTRLALGEFPSLRAVAAWDDPAEPADPAGDTGVGGRKRGPTAADEPLLIMYTSGTTAHPKGCVFTNNAIALNAGAIVRRLEIPDGDCWWNPLPFFHMGGIMLMSSVFAAGGTFVSQAHFTTAEAIALIEREHPAVLYPLFPTITMDLLDDPSFASAPIDDVRLIGSVAPPEVQARIQRALPKSRLFSAYGITELCGCVAFNSPRDSERLRLSTCGPALDGFELRVVDPETNQPLGSGEHGELVGRGVQMFTGYYGNPAATADVIDEDGFFHTGDLCSMDEHGVVSYHGRLKDMLKVGGENVSAIEVESLLSTHPAIKLAQVVGIPDPRLIEVPVAFVELASGYSLTAAEVTAHCSGQIASFKIPRHVRFVTEWPMSATKIQKFRLRDQLVAELAAEGRSDLADVARS
jgi:acyl-CoA synthetase (AMP-forming)/AMP-acid ligase II